jgi:hypothetical protein
MHRLRDRTYVGTPGETATLTTILDGGGQASATVDGAPFTGSRFDLPLATGAQLVLELRLVGPTGASCAVGIATVDGGQDGDLLLCQPHAPVAVQDYTFSVAGQNSVAGLAAIRGNNAPTRAAAPRSKARPSKKAASRGAKKAPKKAPKKNAKKNAKKRGGGR